MTRKELEDMLKNKASGKLICQALNISLATYREKRFTKIERTRDYSPKNPVIFLSLRWCEIITNHVCWYEQDTVMSMLRYIVLESESLSDIAWN